MTAMSSVKHLPVLLLSVAGLAFSTSCVTLARGAGGMAGIGLANACSVRE